MRFTHDLRVVDKFGENRTLRSCRKSSRIAYKKPGVGDTFEPSISPSLNRSRPKFRERCRLWSGSAAVCRTYSEKSQKSEYNIGFQPTINSTCRLHNCTTSCGHNTVITVEAIACRQRCKHLVDLVACLRCSGDMLRQQNNILTRPRS